MPVLTHPTEWPEAAKRGLTRKVGPLPVWAWGAIIVGTVFVVSRMGKGGGSKSTTLNTLMPGGGGGSYAGGGGGGGGGGTSGGIGTGVGNVDIGAGGGGVDDVGLGAVAPRLEAIYNLPDAYSQGGNGNLPGTWEAIASVVDGVRQLPSGGIQTVGGLTFPIGLTEPQAQEALSHNMSLADWHLYQLSQGVKGATMFGPTSDPIKAAQDAAAAQKAAELFAAGERYASTPGYVNGTYVGIR